MFEPAIIEAMEHGLAFRSPAVIQEASGPRAEAERYRVAMSRQLARIERQVDHWIARGRAARTRLWSEVSRRVASPSDVAALGSVIEAIDARVAEDAKEFRRHERAYRGQIKAARTISPLAAEVAREIAAEALKLMAKERAERVEFGLFVRALLAAQRPGADDGPVFDDPGELERYLLTAVG